MEALQNVGRVLYLAFIFLSVVFLFLLPNF